MMAKSALQLRAEKALDRFRQNARKPIVIEFAGVPKAGKTSTITQLQTFLKRCGFKVQVVIERASVCPIRDKKHANFNVWTACTTLSQILENTQDPPKLDDPQILILDRGLFDSICSLTMMDRLSRIRTADRLKIEEFLLSEEWRNRITGVIFMTVSAEDAMKREQGLLPVEASGSIMNVEVLNQMRATTKECAVRMKDKFQIYEMDTSAAGSNQQKTAERVVDAVLNWIEAELQEEILHLQKSVVTSLFSGQLTLVGDGANGLVTAFGTAGAYRPRSEVEADSAVIQALPVVIVRNKSGDVLRLRRRERSEKNPLHEKVVIWAGGHVRREDGLNGKAIVHGAMRELQEELRLNVEPNELRLLGAVYSDSGNGTSKHVAVVFEWRAETDDVAVTLSASEFFERRGTSLSGTFIPVSELVSEIAANKIVEPWSVEIITKLLSANTSTLPKQLF
jgi:predicted NUDIX family phosphoesterase